MVPFWNHRSDRRLSMHFHLAPFHAFGRRLGQAPQFWVPGVPRLGGFHLRPFCSRFGEMTGVKLAVAVENGVKEKVSETGVQVASLVVDTVFLCLWGLVQAIAESLLRSLRS